MLHLSRRDLILLVLLTLFWGLNWPVMKFGVAELPPLYFRSICIAGGLGVMYAWARATGVSLAMPPGAFPVLFRLAVPNVIVWHLVVVIALKMLPSGRAAILGYTMPIWAVLAGLLFFGERPVPRHWLGIVAALAGTLLLLSSEFTALTGSPLGTLMMLAAAAFWGFGTHLLRRNLTDMPVLALTYWMLVLALPFMVLGSVLFERAAWRAPDAWEWASIVYNIFLAIAFCHVVWSKLARTLPPAASGLSVMMIPVLGVFSGMWLLGETPHWQDYAALALILVALSTVLFGRRTPAVTDAAHAE
jgi:drug/metabolite transporter (DMT)-like permease